VGGAGAPLLRSNAESCETACEDVRPGAEERPLLEDDTQKRSEAVAENTSL
jgi:hypothetical protein